MSGQVENTGTPRRYNDNGTSKVVCCKDAKIIANKVFASGVEDCRLLVVEDCNGVCTEFFKMTLKVCPVMQDKTCANGKDFNDYRGATKEDHVKLVGYVNDCNNHYEVISLSLFPEAGQSAQELAEAILLLICASIGAPANFVEESGLLPQPDTKCVMLYDRALAPSNPLRYRGGLLNNNPLAWTDNTFIGNGDVSLKYRATILSFRVDGVQQGGAGTVSPEWNFGTDFEFGTSTVDGENLNQNVSNWLNSLPLIQNAGVQFEDNLGVIKHQAGTDIDIVIKMEYLDQLTTSWFEWQGRYAASTYAGDYFSNPTFGETVFDPQQANQEQECLPIS